MHPYFQWLVVSRKHRERQIIKITLTPFAAVTLPLWVSVVFSTSFDVFATTTWAVNTFIPTELPELFVTFVIIKEVMKLKHARIIIRFSLLW